MKKIEYLLVKILSKLCGREELLCRFFVKNGVKLGKNVHIYSNILASEPYLIDIGDNVTISHAVDFITHDNSVSKFIGKDYDLYGKIVIGNNCFIGAHSVLLYGINIADNVIVAAGSVVTKSISDNFVLVGGNPARVIGTWNEFNKKVSDNAINITGCSRLEKYNKVIRNKEKWIVR